MMRPWVTGAWISIPVDLEHVGDTPVCVARVGDAAYDRHEALVTPTARRMASTALTRPVVLHDVSFS